MAEDKSTPAPKKEKAPPRTRRTGSEEGGCSRVAEMPPPRRRPPKRNPPRRRRPKAAGAGDKGAKKDAPAAEGGSTRRRPRGQARRNGRRRRQAADRRGSAQGGAGRDQGPQAKGAKNITTGLANILASFNNTVVTITDLKGNVIAWSSAGKCNFRGSRKSTAYAAQIVAQDAARNAMAHGLKDVQIRVTGPGLGRDSAIRALQAIGLEITSIIDVTPVPHNGCRPRKRRRV